jgi:hypothetical protein
VVSRVVLVLLCLVARSGPAFHCTLYTVEFWSTNLTKVQTRNIHPDQTILVISSGLFLTPESILQVKLGDTWFVL